MDVIAEFNKRYILRPVFDATKEHDEYGCGFQFDLTERKTGTKLADVRLVTESEGEWADTHTYPIWDLQMECSPEFVEKYVTENMQSYYAQGLAFYSNRELMRFLAEHTYETTADGAVLTE